MARKNVKNGKDQLELVVIRDENLISVAGGGTKAEARIHSTLSSMVSDVLKNFGSALQTAARG